MKWQSAILVGILCLLIPFGMVSAQDTTTPPDTITVVGSGSASGTPDIATLDIGVQTTDADVTQAFAQTNQGINAVIDAMTGAGVAREDMRTSGLSIYVQQPPSPDSQGTPQYQVSNQVHITVRDISKVEDVINAAVNAGANNIFGFSLGIADQSALETEARAQAVADAHNRAEELAGLVGAQLGTVVTVNETPGNSPQPMTFQSSALASGSGGAVVETGQLNVNLQVEITYRIKQP